MARIVIIDSFAENGLAIENTLRLAGHEVLSTVDGRDGADLCRSTAADVAITCVYMPGQGLATINELHEAFPVLAIIAFCTGPGATNLAGCARSLGATKAVREPAEPRELVIAVEEVLSSRRCARATGIDRTTPAA